MGTEFGKWLKASRGIRRQESGYRKQAAGNRRKETGCRNQATGNRLQETGCGKQAAGNRRQETGYRKQATGIRLQESGYRNQATGYRKQAAGNRRQESGYRNQAAGNRLQESGCRKQAAGNRNQGTIGEHLPELMIEEYAVLANDYIRMDHREYLWADITSFHVGVIGYWGGGQMRARISLSLADGSSASTDVLKSINKVEYLVDKYWNHWHSLNTQRESSGKAQ